TGPSPLSKRWAITIAVSPVTCTASPRREDVRAVTRLRPRRPPLRPAHVPQPGLRPAPGRRRPSSHCATRGTHRGCVLWDGTVDAGADGGLSVGIGGGA